MDSPQRGISRTAGTIAFVFVLVLLLFDFADQGLLSPLLSPLLLDFFGRTSNVVPLGWVTFTLTALSAVSMILAGITADRTSRVRLCAAGGLVYGFFSILAILTPHGHAGYVFFYLTRALNGIGIGVIVPSVFSLIGDLVRPERRATAFGFMSVAMLAGRFFGFLIAGSLGGDWRLAYFLIGSVNLVLAAALLTVKEPKHGAREEELRRVIDEGAEYRFRLSRKDVGLIRSSRSNFWLVLNFIDVFPGSIVLFLIFKYMKDKHNVEAGVVNVILFFVFVSGAVGALVFGRLGDRGFRKDKRARAFIALLCNACPMLFMVLFLQSKVMVPAGAALSTSLAVPGMWPLILTMSAAMFINQGVNPNWYSSITDVNVPEHRAAMISLASVMDMIGGALGPLVASYIASLWGIQAAMGSVLAFWGLNIFFWFPILAHIRQDLKRVHEVLQDRAAQMRRSLTEHAG